MLHVLERKHFGVEIDMRERKRLFSLVELLVVVAIIGILAALLLTVMGFHNDKAHTLQCQENLRNLGLASNTFIGEWGALPYHGIVSFDDRLYFYDGRAAGKTADHGNTFIEKDPGKIVDLNKADGNAQRHLIDSPKVMQYVCPDEARKTYKVNSKGELVGHMNDGIVYDLWKGIEVFPRTYNVTSTVYQSGTPKPLMAFDMPDATFYLVLCLISFAVHNGNLTMRPVLSH